MGGTQEGRVADVVGEVGGHGILIAVAFLEVVHRRAPELHVGAGEVFVVRKTGEVRILARPDISQLVGLVRDDDRIIARNIEFFIREGRSEHADIIDIVLGRRILPVELDGQAIGERADEVQAVIVIRRLLVHLTAGKRLLHAAIGHEIETGA